MDLPTLRTWTHVCRAYLSEVTYQHGHMLFDECVTYQHGQHVCRAYLTALVSVHLPTWTHVCRESFDGVSECYQPTWTQVMSVERI